MPTLTDVLILSKLFLFVSIFTDVPTFFWTVSICAYFHWCAYLFYTVGNIHNSNNVPVPWIVYSLGNPNFLNFSSFGFESSPTTKKNVRFIWFWSQFKFLFPFVSFMRRQWIIALLTQLNSRGCFCCVSQNIIFSL